MSCFWCSRHSSPLTPGRSDLGRWQRPRRSDMKRPGWPAGSHVMRQGGAQERGMMGRGLFKFKKGKDKVAKLESIKVHVSLLPVACLSQSVSSLAFCLSQTLQKQVNFLGKCYRACEETQLPSPNQHGLLHSPPLLGKWFKQDHVCVWM